MTDESEVLRAAQVPYLVGGLVVCGLTALAIWAFALERGALRQVVAPVSADQRLTGSAFSVSRGRPDRRRGARLCRFAPAVPAGTCPGPDAKNNRRRRSFSVSPEAPELISLPHGGARGTFLDGGGTGNRRSATGSALSGRRVARYQVPSSTFTSDASFPPREMRRRRSRPGFGWANGRKSAPRSRTRRLGSAESRETGGRRSPFVWGGRLSRRQGSEPEPTSSSLSSSSASWALTNS